MSSGTFKLKNCVGGDSILGFNVMKNMGKNLCDYIEEYQSLGIDFMFSMIRELIRAL